MSSSGPPSRLSNGSNTPPTSPQPRSPCSRTLSATTMLIIDHFSELTEGHKGTAICANGNSGKARFYLAVFPKNNLTWVSNDVLVCLYFYEEEIEVRYKVAIVDGKREKRYCQEYHWRKYGKSGHHTAKFISRDELLEPTNGYLVNDKLTLACELEILHPSSTANLKLHQFSTHSADFSALLASGQFADTKLIVGGRQFSVHRAILAGRSAVFAKMFEHEFKEKEKASVDITDVEADVCEQLLRYIYADRVDGLEALAAELLAAADKYQVDSLKHLCEHYLASTLTVDTVARLLLLADLHSAGQLKSQCIDYITDNMAKVKHTEAWQIVTTTRPELGIELLLMLSAKHDQLKAKA